MHVILFFLFPFLFSSFIIIYVNIFFNERKIFYGSYRVRGAPWGAGPKAVAFLAFRGIRHCIDVTVYATNISQTTPLITPLLIANLEDELSHGLESDGTLVSVAEYRDEFDELYDRNGHEALLAHWIQRLYPSRNYRRWLINDDCSQGPALPVEKIRAPPQV